MWCCVLTFPRSNPARARLRRRWAAARSGRRSSCWRRTPGPPEERRGLRSLPLTHLQWVEGWGKKEKKREKWAKWQWWKTHSEHEIPARRWTRGEAAAHLLTLNIVMHEHLGPRHAEWGATHEGGRRQQMDSGQFKPWRGLNWILQN